MNRIAFKIAIVTARDDDDARLLSVNFKNIHNWKNSQSASEIRDEDGRG